jgi:hypothetical protein
LESVEAPMTATELGLKNAVRVIRIIDL